MNKIKQILSKILAGLKGIGYNVGYFFSDIYDKALGKVLGKFLKKHPKKDKKSPEEVEYFSDEASLNREKHKAKKKTKKTLGLIIMAAGCSVLFILSVIMCIVNCSLSYDLAEQYINEEIESSLTAYQAVVNEKLDIIRLEVEAVAAKETIYTGNLQMAARKKLLEKEVEGTSFKDFSIAYEDGTTYSNTDISQRDYFKEASAGTTYIFANFAAGEQYAANEVHKLDNILSLRDHANAAPLNIITAGNIGNHDGVFGILFFVPLLFRQRAGGIAFR